MCDGPGGLCFSIDGLEGLVIVFIIEGKGRLTVNSPSCMACLISYIRLDVLGRGFH